MGWQVIQFLYGFLHGIIRVGFGVLVGHVTCTTWAQLFENWGSIPPQLTI
jgi:hypothetical protein